MLGRLRWQSNNSLILHLGWASSELLRGKIHDESAKQKSVKHRTVTFAANFGLAKLLVTGSATKPIDFGP